MGELEMVKLFLNSGANIFETTKRGSNALHYGLF